MTNDEVMFLKSVVNENFEEMIFYLEKSNVAVDVKNNYALKWACAKGNEKMVTCLINKGADVNTPKSFIINLYDDFHSYGDMKIAMDSSADINHSKGAGLKIACKNGHYECTKILIDNGADIHVEEEYPLRLACKYGHPKIVKLILKHKSNVRIMKEFCFYWACRHGHVEIAKMLYEYDPTIDIHIDDDKIIKAVEERDHKDVLKFLNSLIKGE